MARLHDRELADRLNRECREQRRWWHGERGCDRFEGRLTGGRDVAAVVLLCMLHGVEGEIANVKHGGEQAAHLRVTAAVAQQSHGRRVVHGGHAAGARRRGKCAHGGLVSGVDLEDGHGVGGVLPLGRIVDARHLRRRHDTVVARRLHGGDIAVGSR